MANPKAMMNQLLILFERLVQPTFLVNVIQLVYFILNYS